MRYQFNRNTFFHYKQMAIMLFAIAVFALAPLSSPAYAFPHHGDEGMHHMERMADALNLTEAQRQQFKQIHRDGRNAGMTLHDAMQDNREAMMKLDPGAKNYSAQVAKLAAEMGELVKQMGIHRGEQRRKVYDILTPEQRNKAAEMKKHFRPDGKPSFRHGGPGSEHCNVSVKGRV